MTLCEYYGRCQPEVLGNCCFNNGFWKDKRRKNYGEECRFHKDIRQKRHIIAVCCSCGIKLTWSDYEAGRVIIEEIKNPYTDEVEDYEIWCINCYDEEFGEGDDEEFLDDC